ncbi:hypothetical protein RD792_008097 [Penstemon davidsonii]|uniref:Glycosyltransferase n=1 Tax=Penstemon davidsonii TaxID=160366 RepID=A0ABR0D9I0_9LAMI|nr:hypothetical protein RD792_008097 [Penstemon davidsonii]
MPRYSISDASSHIGPVDNWERATLLTRRRLVHRGGNNSHDGSDNTTEGVLEFIVSKPENFKKRAGDIHNTSRLIEGNYIELLEREEINGNVKQWAITPTMKLNNTKTGHKCLDWLNKQGPRSVIYVSFGTSISISDEEAKEFAMGLELSKKKFVWVVRDADKTNIFDGEDRRIELPEGFEERVRDYGLVVRDWAPQIEILAHESIGGFMSHCGWNSCLESITMGVPIAALPMHSDQPLNALFLTEVLKIGVIVREWGERNEVVKASKIKNVVERLMGCEEGDEMRKRAKELSVEIKKSMEEGFGYDYKTDDYKLVILESSNYWLSKKQTCYTDVYSLKSNSWSLGPTKNDLRKLHTTPGVHVGGVLHWVDSRVPLENKFEIVSFDLATEEWTIPPPIPPGPSTCLKKMILSNHNGSLCATFHYYTHVDMWVMKIDQGINISWSKLFTIKDDYYNSGLRIIAIGNLEKMNQQKVLIRCRFKLKWYDIDKEIKEDVDTFGASYFFNSLNYYEGLARV